MIRVGRFEAYLLYALIVLGMGTFLLTRLQAFEGWLLVPQRGSESVIVRPTAGFSLAPLQRNTPADALLVEHPEHYRRFLDPDQSYDAVQLPVHLSVAPHTEELTLRVEAATGGDVAEIALQHQGSARVGNWRFRRAAEQPAPGRFWVLIVTRVAFTPAQATGAGLFALGVIGFVGFRWYLNRRPPARNTRRTRLPVETPTPPAD